MSRSSLLTITESINVATVFRQNLGNQIVDVFLFRQIAKPSEGLNFTFAMSVKNATMQDVAINSLIMKEAQIKAGLVTVLGAAPTFYMPVASIYPDNCINSSIDPDSGETDVDCGGSQCAQCPGGKACLVDSDCVSNKCTSVDVGGTPKNLCLSQSYSAANTASPALWTLALGVAVSVVAIMWS